MTEIIKKIKEEEIINDKSFIMSEDRFNYPDMGDFYVNAVDSGYQKRVKELIERNEAVENTVAGDGLSTLSPTTQPLEAQNFYTMTGPPVDRLGDHPNEGVIFFKAKVNFTPREINGDYNLDNLDEVNRVRAGKIDGDTIYLSYDDIDAGTDGAKQLLIDSKKFSEHEINKVIGKDDVPEIAIRFAGMNAPEIKKYTYEKDVDVDKEIKEGTIKAFPYGVARMDRKNFLVDRSLGLADNEELLFINTGFGVDWHQITNLPIKSSGKYGKKFLEILKDEGEDDPVRAAAGTRAQKAFTTLIAAADNNEVYFMVDKTTLNKNNTQYPTTFDGVNVYSKGIDRGKYLLSQWTDYRDYKYAGYSQWGMDAYDRWLGAPYVKIGGKWINAAKYVIATVPETEVLPDFSDLPSAEAAGSLAARLFDLNSYDYTNRKAADMAGKLAEELDDRRRIQKEIFNTDFTSLREWTVVLGDSAFFVPPTSIRTTTINTQERLPVIRGKGSITKGNPKIQRMIELSLYFNEEQGINGYPYKTKLPSGEEITYHMNGLRALLSQFKFVPFLPIDNEYINEVLGIEAVTLANIQVATMPGYPRLLMCTITLHDFDYLQYMPEIPLDTSKEDEYYNPFATTFNFELMRWYYQQPLIKGDKLQGHSSDSVQFLEATEGHKTALIPMSFESSDVKFFEPNEEHLKRMHQVKIQRVDNNRTVNLYDDDTKQLVEDMQPVYEAMLSTLGSITGKLKSIGEKDGHRIRLSKDLAMDTDPTFKKVGVQRVDEKGRLITSHHEISNDLIDYTNEIISNMQKANAEGTILTSPRVISEITRSGAKDDSKMYLTLNVVMDISRDYIVSDSQLSKVVNEVELLIEEKLDKYSAEGKVNIPIIAEFDYDNGEFYLNKNGFMIDPTSPAIQFISFFKGLDKNAYENNGNLSINDEVNSMKQDLDSASLDTVMYEEHVIGAVRVKSMSCVYGNTYTQIGLNGTEGYAPQYMGGQDAMIELSIETSDPFVLNSLESMPRRSAYLTREYRQVLPSSPLRIESELTRLFGISEVLIEEVNTATVPGYPGLHTVTMRLMSVDRTLRNREGIEKVNEFAHGGSIANDGAATIRMNTFLDLQKSFGEAELYPDLELPKISELKALGYDFVRHSLDSTRIYPDPDFYFYYGHVLHSEILRETVLNFAGDEEKDINWAESDGTQYTSTLDGDKVVDTVATNDLAEAKEKSEEKLNKVTQKIKLREERRERLQGKLDVINNLNTYASVDAWNIGPEVKVMMMENGYADLLKAHKDNEAAGRSTEETDWLYNRMADIRTASDLIKHYISKPITHSTKPARIGGHKLAIDYALNSTELKEAFSLLGIDHDGIFSSTSSKIIYAAACAASGEREYSEEIDKERWEPKQDFLGYKVVSGQDQNGYEEVEVGDYASAVEFGPYRIKMYTADEMTSIIGEKTERHIENAEHNVNSEMYLIDPYYRTQATEDQIIEYKKGNIENEKYAAIAFMRIVLYWLARLIDENFIPNLSADVLREEFEATLKANLTDLEDAKEITVGDVVTKTLTGRSLGLAADAIMNSPEKRVVSNDEYDMYKSQINDYLNFLDDADRPMDAGKIFLATFLALTGMEGYQLIKEKNYAELNAVKTSIMSVGATKDYSTSEHILLRKFMLALVGLDVINDETTISLLGDDPIQDKRRSLMEKKYIKFADDPSKYVMHSFHDMCVNDMRGRMARAFPTFYVTLVDEGREIGLWKLNDNFYNINSIAEIQVHRSRRLPADTCRIVMSNMFHTYTTDDEDRKITYEYNPRDVFNSLFNPSAIYRTEQARRLNQQPLNKVKLTTGTRMHVRMGYGSNAATLPIVFNGVIAEINAGEIVEIIGQGDGVELTNPIFEDLDGDELTHKDSFVPFVRDWFNNASTPKEIIDNLLNTHDSFVAKHARELTNGYYRSPHPYGIVHFGDRLYTDVFKNGETTQNIFEAINKPKWGDLTNKKDGLWELDEAPKISMELMGKTPWDILHIAASVSPDYIVGVAPFGMRSTIFHGHPRYYYAYDYMQDENGYVFEKRKPYQQYHVITSQSDIIRNEIKASGDAVRTNGVGTWKSKGILGFGDKIKSTSRLFVDIDIYSDFQKSMVYDTQLYDKGVPLTSFFGQAMQGIENYVFDGGEEGIVQNGKKHAWRATANALKNSIKDMYNGEIIIMGSPAMKPHDRIFINDTYENINGQVLVEGLVHNLSVDTGFTTSITPDCIATVDDRFEVAVQQIGSRMMSHYHVVAGAVMLTSLVVGRQSLIIKGAANLMTKGAKMANNKSLEIYNKVATSQKDSFDMVDKMKDIKNGVRGALAVTKFAGPAGMVASLVAEWAIIYGIGKFLNYKATEAIKNTQVLQVFPLKKNGKVLSAGLNGNTGLVFGSTNYDKLGMIDSILSKLDDSEGTKGAVESVLQFLATDEIKAAVAAKSAPLSGESKTEEELFNMLNSIAKSEARKINNYRYLMIEPRVQPENIAEHSTKIIERHSLTDNRAIEAQMRVTTENDYLKSSEKINQAISDGILKLAWDSQVSDIKRENKTFRINSARVDIDTFVKDEDGRDVYDIPFLKPEAIAILDEIVARARTLTNRIDEDIEITNDSVIVLESALIVGSESISNTGFRFVIEATGESADSLISVPIRTLEEEYAASYAEGASHNQHIFTAENQGGNKYVITVMPSIL